jgi:PilZ domain
LFWKKMKQITDTQDPMEADEQREAYRFIFKGEFRLPMNFKQKPVQVINISAGGMAFKNEGFKQYDADQITLVFDLPHHRQETVFSAQLRILDISDQGICHCIFENCTIQEYEIIHKYVLEMQKKELSAQHRNRLARNKSTRNRFK